MTNKTVRDAVEYFGGEWPENAGEGDTIAYGLYVKKLWPQYEGQLLPAIEQTVCTRAQFEADAEVWRREKEAVEWSGEGLPPVGCQFEFSLNGVSWEHRIMLFNDGISCLMAHGRYPANRWHYKSDDPDMQFRPLKTEKEREVEAMEAVISNQIQHNVAFTKKGIVKALYEAGFGYRKQEGNQ